MTFFSFLAVASDLIPLEQVPRALRQRALIKNLHHMFYQPTHSR